MMSTSALSPASDHATWSVLALAQSLRRAGLHREAIRRLDDAMRTPLRHDEVFAGMALALKARSQVQLMDDAGATLTIRLVPEALRRLNPKIDAYCQIVWGLVYRRRAYRSWKAGAADLGVLHAALDCFARARCAAENGIEQRLALVSELNQIYPLGLAAAIAGRSQQENPQLLVAAIHAESGARVMTPLEDAANVAGLTIIADLAIGAALPPAALIKLSDTMAFRQACVHILGADPTTWPRELLRAASAANVPFDQKARALVLGSRCLTRANESTVDQELIQAYLIHLTDCDCAQSKAVATQNGACQSVRQLVPGFGEQWDLLRRMSRHPFPGRRIFR